MNAMDAKRKKTHETHLTELMGIDKISEAYNIWCVLPATSTIEERFFAFYDYIGDYYYTINRAWWITEKGRNRIDHLLGPHANTLVKAWLVKENQ